MSLDDGSVEWYLARDGEQHGPLTAAELDKFIELGHLKPTDLLWRAGFDDWRGAAEVFPPLPPSQPAPAVTATTAPAWNAQQKADNPDTATARFTVRPGAEKHVNSQAEMKAGGNQMPIDEKRVEAPQSRQQEDTLAAPGLETIGHVVGTGPVEPSLRDPATADRSRSGDAFARTRPQGRQDDLRAGPTSRDPFQLERTVRPERQAGSRQPVQSSSVATAASATTADGETFFDDEPNGRSGWLTVAAALFVFVLLGAGGLFAYNNQEHIASFYNGLATKTKPGDIEVVRAPQQVVRELPAASETTTPIQLQSMNAAAPNNPAATEEPLPEVPILTSKLWQYAQLEFGEWTKDRLVFVKQLAEQKKPKEEVNSYLVESFVKFRRDNAAIALLASPEKLEQIAQAFVANLRALRQKDANACYAFISNGESTPEVAALYFEPATGTKLEAQMLAIMQAIVEGRTTPAGTRRPPSAGDFNKLSEELGRRGWTAAELQLFSDPDALSKAKPEVVCRLVTEWFATQTELADQTARDQLIAASLRPVIGG